jgi:uncharacterized protein YkwD
MGFWTERQRWAKAVSTAVLIAAAPFAMGATDFNSNLDGRILGCHNRERSSLDIPALAWDPALERDAELWARHLTAVGYLVHSPDEPANPDPEGENLWAGTRGYYGPEAMVGLWIAEKKDFVPGIFPHNSSTGDLEAIGHYTQVMWRSTKAVGCAVAHGRDDDFLVCRYSEGGNVIGEKPF